MRRIVIDNEKRMIQGYEVIHAVQLAGGEVILAENKAADEPYMVCDNSWDNPLGIDWYTNAVASADFMEIMREFTDRLTARVETVEAERAERGIPLQTLTAADCYPKGMDTDMVGQVVVIKPEKLSPEYRSIDHQLALCTGGNGARPEARGRAVFCTNLYDGKSSRYNRIDIAGTVSAERLPDWAREKLAALQKPNEREQTADEQQGGTFSIYQLKRNDSTRDLRFEPLERLTAAGLTVNRINYDCVYTAPITADTDSLGKIYEKFNIDHPKDFIGQSLSISDVITINRGGQQTSHYIDRLGFKEIPGFIQSAEKESVIDKIRQGKQEQARPKTTHKKREKGGLEL